jgi:hypothetical protein
MDSLSELEGAANDLALVADNGLLGELKESIAYALRGRPRNDFEARPGLRQDVNEFAGLLQSFTGQPYQRCQLAALNQLLPGNRYAESLDTLRAFADKIREQSNRERATTIIAAERRRRAS